jgi:hypothetical protein
MGYRSDVHIGLSTKAKTQILITSTPLPGLMREKYCSVDNHESGITYYSWESLKWYDGYDNVDEVMNFLAELGGEEYGFIRIGEDDSDVEYQGSIWDLGMAINTSVNLGEF